MVFIPHPSRNRRKRPRRLLVVGLAVLIAALLGGELVARYAIGLGDPPLLVIDPTIEYLNKPGTYHRFGNTIHINPGSMRSPDFPREKTNPTELRVLVIGDSVVFGGSLLDDTRTSTALLAADLSVTTGRPVIVGNVSAGSWGPQNELAYLERFGAFDAEAIVVVWSSHDAWDVPSFGPLGAEQPTEAPRSALVELITRYVWPRITSSGNAAVALAPTQQQIDEGLAAARAQLNWIKSRGIPVAVVLHKTRSELGESKVRHYESLRTVAEQAGIPVYESESVLGPAVAKGESVFTDDIHPGAPGQALVAELYAKVVSDLLSGAGGASKGDAPGGR